MRCVKFAEFAAGKMMGFALLNPSYEIVPEILLSDELGFGAAGVIDRNR
jgi:hypothetical protein